MFIVGRISGHLRPGGRAGEKQGGMSFGVDGVDAVDPMRVNYTMWGLA